MYVEQVFRGDYIDTIINFRRNPRNSLTYFIKIIYLRLLDEKNNILLNEKIIKTPDDEKKTN